jgi:LysM repeat protein
VAAGQALVDESPAASAGVDASPAFGPPPGTGAPGFLAGRGSRSRSEPPLASDEEPGDLAEEDWRAEREADLRVRRPGPDARRMPIGYAPVAPGREDRRAGARRDPAAPSWEQPRRLEAFPTLKSRAARGIPRPAVYALVVLVVGVALFTAPALLKGLGGGGNGDASPTPVASASIQPTSEPSATPVPTPGEVVYIVKPNDVLSVIAAKYGVTIAQILAANPSIKNPNRIAVGDRIVIPQPLPSVIVEITPAP